MPVEPSRSLVIAQISDMHVREEGELAYRRVDTATFLARAVEHIGHMRPRPDLVLATGDLVDKGLVTEYERLRRLLAPLPMPVYLIPGNHDDRDAIRAVFADHRYLPRDGFLHYVIDDPRLRIIALDTLVPGQGGGLMCDDRLAWLEARLADAPDRATIVFMHHPPFKTGIAFMDRLGLDNAERMGAIVAKHGRVEHVVCGHLHRPIQKRWYGTIASTAPSTAHQVTLEVTQDTPSGFILEPPAFLLHLWRDDLGLVTHTVYVGEFAGPYPFR